MKHRLNIMTIAVAAFTLALLSTSAFAQTYKPDWITKAVLAKGGTDPSNTFTITASPTQSGNLNWTLPIGNAGGNGYVLSSTTGGVLSWVDPAASVTLAGDVTGAANSNSIAATLAAGNHIVSALNLATAATLKSDVLMYDATLKVASNNLGIDLTHANSWTGAQTFTNSASTGTAATVSNTHNAAGDVALTLSTANASATALDVTAGSVKIEPFTSAGIVHNTSAGVLTSSTIVNADVASGAAIDFSKLASLATGHIIAGNGGTATDVTVGGDVTIGNTGTVTIANSAVTTAKIADANVTNAKLANSTMTFTSTGSTLTASGSVALGGSPNYDLNLGHANTWTGTQTLGAHAYSKASVSTANATEDDYSLSASNSFFSVASTATSGTVLSSIQNGTDGRVIILVNTGAKNITLLNDDGNTGTAANRFKFVGGAAGNLIMAPDATVTLVYDGTSTRWRLLSAQ